MTLDSYRDHVKPIIDPVVAACVRLGITPDSCTILSLVAAAGAGIGFYFYEIWIGTVCILLNAIFDALDGSIARAMNLQSLRGDFLDHTVDRYADIFMICGIFAGPLCPWHIGVFGLTGALMASYLGTQAQAVGIGRFYGGFLGRADRLILLIGAGVASLISSILIIGLSLFAWVLLIFGIFGHITAAQRFMHVWKQL
jgi:Phosphatidylglycerophosphate synthase